MAECVFIGVFLLFGAFFHYIAISSRERMSTRVDPRGSRDTVSVLVGGGSDDPDRLCEECGVRWNSKFHEDWDHNCPTEDYECDEC